MHGKNCQLGPENNALERGDKCENYIHRQFSPFQYIKTEILTQIPKKKKFFSK